MARIAPNGLVVSDGGQWYYLNPKWHPYLDKPTEKRPGFMEALGAAKLTGEQLRVGNVATKFTWRGMRSTVAISRSAAVKRSSRCSFPSSDFAST